MNEKELALELKEKCINANTEISDYLGMSIPLNHEELKNIDIDKLIIEAKKINLTIDYIKNIKFIKPTKSDKNSIFVYLND